MLVRNGGERLDEVILDVDAMPVDVHGHLLGSTYNGPYKRTVFLPLFITCGETGEVLGAFRHSTGSDPLSEGHDSHRRAGSGPCRGPRHVSL